MESKEYVATFEAGSTGLILQRIHGHAVVTRLQCLDSGEAGQGADQGVTVGSVVMEVVGESEPGDEGDCDKVFEALARARRPMRVVFLRLAQLLRTLRTPLPLVVWRGEVDLRLPGSRDVLLSGPAAAAIVRVAQVGTHRLELQWACAPWLCVVVLYEDGRRSDATSYRVLGVVVQAFKPGSTAPPTPPKWLRHSRLAQAVRRLTVGHCAATGQGQGQCQGHEAELHLEHRRSKLELMRGLAARMFPDELVLQAEGSGGPRVALAGFLDLRLTRLGISVWWAKRWFVLRTDGSLQWYLDAPDGAIQAHAHAQVQRAASSSAVASDTLSEAARLGLSTPPASRPARRGSLSRDSPSEGSAGAWSPAGPWNDSPGSLRGLSGSHSGRRRRPVGGIRVSQAHFARGSRYRVSDVFASLPASLAQDDRVLVLRTLDPVRTVVLRAGSAEAARTWAECIVHDIRR